MARTERTFFMTIALNLIYNKKLLVTNQTKLVVFFVFFAFSWGLTFFEGFSSSGF